MVVFVKILLLSLFLLALAFIGFGIKLFFDKKAEFTGGKCSACACEENTESCEIK